VTVDVHVHLAGISPDNGCFLNPRAAGPVLGSTERLALRLFARDRAEFDRRARRRLKKLVDGSGLDAIGLLALDGVYDAKGVLDDRRTGLLVSNDYLFEVASDSPKYLPIPSINPQRRDALEELERVSELGAVAIKTLPNAQNFDPDSKQYLPFWRRMAELDLPLLAHTGTEFTLPEHEKSYGDPHRLRRALGEGVTVIAAHCGTGGGRLLVEHFQHWLTMLGQYPRLFGDASALASPGRLPFLGQVLRHQVARERLVLGSDYPVPVTPILLAPRLGMRDALRLQRISNPIRRNLETLRAAGMPEAVKRRAGIILRLPERTASTHER